MCFQMKAIGRAMLRRSARAARELIERGRTARARRNNKVAYVRWLTSPAGTRPESYLRSFAPSLSTRAMLWADDLCSGHITKPRKIGRIYVPSHPMAKVRAIRWYARHYRPKFFVETGTHMGDTTAAVADLFQQCFTIELSDQLYRRASVRFSKTPNVRCLQGDSGRMISDLIRNHLPGPALFWLDAHASGGVTTNAGYDPIFAELEAILADPEAGHVILIDDARGHRVDKIRLMVSRGQSFTIKNDIVRIAPLSDHS
jgi:hypothetical protein